jgi:hypothetical protein
MLRINHILLLLILLASHMDSQHIALWSCSFLYLHLRRIMNPPFHPPSVCPSANLSSFHLPHTETRQWGPHPSSVFPEISALPGALISHWGTRFCILYIFPNFIHYLLYKRLYFQLFTFCRHHRRPTFLLATRNPCHPWLEHYFSFSPADIVYVFRILPRSLPFIL